MIDCYSQNGWDPLKTVILGDFIPPDLLEKALTYSKYEPVKPWLVKIAKETEEDFAEIQNILESYGVEVIRPFNSDFRREFENELEQLQLDDLPFDTLPIPISPRNDFLIYKDIVIGDRPTFSRKWIEENISNKVTYLNETPLDKVHLPCIFRLNDTLIIGDEITDEEFEHIPPLFPKDTQFIKTSVPGHVDARMATLRDGLVVYAANEVTEEDLQATYPGWTKVYCDMHGFNVIGKNQPRKYGEVANYRTALNSLTDGRWDIAGFDGDAETVANIVDKMFSRWTGRAYETHFDVNILTIDPDTSITVGTDQRMIKRIESLGHKMITAPFRHRWFLDQGMHCITADLIREH